MSLKSSVSRIRHVFSHPGEHLHISVGTEFQATLHAGNRGSARTRRFFDAVILISRFEHTCHFQTLRHVTQFIDRTKIFKKFLALLSRLQSQNAIEKLIRQRIHQSVIHTHLFICPPVSLGAYSYDTLVYYSIRGKAVQKENEGSSW